MKDRTARVILDIVFAYTRADRHAKRRLIACVAFVPPAVRTPAPHGSRRVSVRYKTLSARIAAASLRTRVRHPQGAGRCNRGSGANVSGWKALSEIKMHRTTSVSSSSRDIYSCTHTSCGLHNGCGGGGGGEMGSLL